MLRFLCAVKFYFNRSKFCLFFCLIFTIYLFKSLTEASVSGPKKKKNYERRKWKTFILFFNPGIYLQKFLDFIFQEHSKGIN